jgi:NDP-sugar pyrophosphorylase family protein
LVSPAPDSLQQLPVLILAGGLGTRLRTVLADRPKALAPIQDRPFLELQIELLAQQGLREFVLCIGYMGEQIQAYFGDGSRWDVQIHYSIEGERLMGTAGAIKNAAPWIHERALVLNGDTYFEIDYVDFLHQHHLACLDSAALASMALARLDDPSRYGSVELDSEGKRLVGFREKVANATPQPIWVNAGAYMIEKTFLDHIPADSVVSIERDVFPQLLASGAMIAAYRTKARFYDMGTPEGLEQFIAFYLQSQEAGK